MRKNVQTALALLLSAALFPTIALAGVSNASPSSTHRITHNHELVTVSKPILERSYAPAVPEAPKAAKEAARLSLARSHRKPLQPSHNHAAALVFMANCMEDCMRPLIPDELLIACATLCAGGVAPACALVWAGSLESQSAAP